MEISPPAMLMKSSPVALYTSMYLLKLLMSRCSLLIIKIHFSPVSDVVLVPLERHVPVGGVLEEDEGLAVATALSAQAQRHAAPRHSKSINTCSIGA